MYLLTSSFSAPHLQRMLHKGRHKDTHSRLFPIIFFSFFLILDLFYVSWPSNPPVSAPLSPSSSYFNFSICWYTGCEPARRHLPYFITQPSLPSPLQLAINEKLKMWEGGSKGGSKGEERNGSKTIEWVNCEWDSEGARETESEWAWEWAGGTVFRDTLKRGKKERKSKAIKSKLEVIGDWLDEKCHRHKIILELVWPYGIDEYRCCPAGSLAGGELANLNRHPTCEGGKKY